MIVACRAGPLFDYKLPRGKRLRGFTNYTAQKHEELKQPAASSHDKERQSNGVVYKGHDLLQPKSNVCKPYREFKDRPRIGLKRLRFSHRPDLGRGLDWNIRDPHGYGGSSHLRCLCVGSS
ncbi:unnamed protein product [Dovyalis caffra]|uniref:Uncharacterized protein n=1 Tax=Dovyalis caffra TaxID=77055 RepID=A0AAV1RCS5_9ROSI|nr:unnamed protein product [Dovyalis caffra]